MTQFHDTEGRYDTRVRMKLPTAEAVVRGHKSGLFTSADYNNLCQCETLEDIKLHLVSIQRIFGDCASRSIGQYTVTVHSSSITWLCTVLQSGSDYGPYLANEASPLHTTTIVERCTEKLVDDWNRMRANVSVSAFPSAVR